MLGGVFADATRSNTRVIDKTCIFLNRPGFEGGAGCALHLAALRLEAIGLLAAADQGGLGTR